MYNDFMPNSFLIKLVRFLGWLLLVVSLLLFIIGIISIGGDNSFSFWAIAVFFIFAFIGLCLTGYKKIKISQNIDNQKKTLSEKLHEQKEKSIPKQAELQTKLDALKKQPEKGQDEVLSADKPKAKLIIDTKPQTIREKISSIKDQNIRIKTIEELISKYQAYNEGEAEISNDEFNFLLNELKALNPESLIFKKVKTPPPVENIAKNESYVENLIYSIEYLDYQGKCTTRDIQINSFTEENGELYINAFCYLRNEMRQFRVDRVESIAIKGGDPIDYPQQFLWSKYQNTDLYKLQMALNAHADEILALIFIARADGKLLKNEREVICRYIDILIQGIDADLVEKMLQKTICELSNFNGILKRAKAWNSDVKVLILNAASQIVKLQKKPDPMQLATFEKLKAVIG